MKSIKFLFCNFTIISCTLLPLAGQADALPTLAKYRQLKEAVLYSMNRCDLIGEQEVQMTTSSPLAELDAQSQALFLFFEDTIKQRNRCYLQAKKDLDVLLTYSWQYLQVNPSNTNFKWQYELDQSLRFTIEVKATLAKELLHAMLKDVEISLTLPSLDLTQHFVKESLRTKRLMRETAMVNLETQRRQLFLDESTALIGEVDIVKVAFIKLEAAQFYLAYAMLTFEDIYTPARRLFALAKLSGDIDYAVSQLTQLLHYAPYLQGLTTAHTKELVHLSDMGRALAQDIRTTLSEIQADEFEAENENWIVSFYERTSKTSLQLKALLGEITKLHDAKLDKEQHSKQPSIKRMSDTLLEYSAIPQVSLTEIAPKAIDTITIEPAVEQPILFNEDNGSNTEMKNSDSF